MTKKIENTNLLKTLLMTLKASNKDLKSITITINRGKQVADAGDQYIITHSEVKE